MKHRGLQNTELRSMAEEQGLQEGNQIVVQERSLLKDCSYITRQVRKGVVLKLYPYHFYCRMADGTRESFRYNELLGDEARRIFNEGCRTITK